MKRVVALTLLVVLGAVPAHAQTRNATEREVAKASQLLDEASLIKKDRATIFGNVAVVTGVSTLTGSAKGYVSGPRRFTEMWVKRNGRWQEVGGQSTLVPK